MTGTARIALPRLCAITDRGLAGKEHPEIARACIAGGARWIQVREKSLGAGEFLRQAREAVARGKEAGALVMVNDRVDVAVMAGAGGVHVGGGDLPVGETRRLIGDSGIVGISTHSVEEGIAAARLPVDYVAIGPVFATKSKSDTEPVVGVDAVRRLAAAIALPVVAIGGISVERAREVIDAGAQAVAVIGALYDSRRTIEENVAMLLRALDA